MVITEHRHVAVGGIENNLVLVFITNLALLQIEHILVIAAIKFSYVLNHFCHGMLQKELVIRFEYLQAVFVDICGFEIFHGDQRLLFLFLNFLLGHTLKL